MPIFRKGDKSVLFVHVPKAGGTTIENLFANSGWEVHFLDKGGPKSLNSHRLCSPQHMHASLLADSLRLGSFDLIFMVVRDPLARFKSEVAMRHPNLTEPWSDKVDEWATGALRRFSVNPYVLDNHLRPQWEFYVPGALVWQLEEGLGGLVEVLRNSIDDELSENIPHVQRAPGEVSSSEIAVPDLLVRRVISLYRQDYSQFSYVMPAGF